MSIASCDTGHEMRDAILRACFPAFHKLYSTWRADEEDERVPFDPERARRALKEDLAPLLRYRWRCAQEERKTGPEADLKRHLRVTKLPPMARLPVGRDEDEK